MSAYMRLVCGFCLSALLHAGLFYVYANRVEPPPSLVLGEQSMLRPLALSMFEPVSKTVMIEQPKTVLKSAVTSKKALKKKLNITKPSVLKDTPPAEQQQPTQVHDFARAAQPASQSSPPVLNTRPVYFAQAAPRYPRKALSKGQEGTVLLMLLVSAEGYVVDVEVVDSSGVKSLDRAAQRAVKQWRLKPTESGGVAVASRVKVPVKFNIKSS